MNKTLQANICIFIAAVIWGSAFVTQRMGMDAIGPLYFNGLRSLLGCAVLCLVVLVTDKTGLAKDLEPKFEAPREDDVKAGNSKTPREDDVKAGNSKTPREDGFWNEGRKSLLKGGLACGVIVCAAGNFQQVGLVTVDAGKCGFLTAMYIVLVPLLGILLRQPIKSNHIVGALLGVIGLYFLCIKGDFSLAPGDLFSLIGALFWAFHILCVDHFAPKCNPIKLSAAQFFVSAIGSIILASFTEEISVAAVQQGAFAIAYTGVMSTAVAFTLQVFAQRHANPTAASIIMSMEAVFAVICGFLFLGEVLTVREFFGCIIMFVAVIVAQISPRDLFKKRSS